MSRNVISCMQPAGQGNDFRVDSKGTNGKPTFRRLANMLWLSEICNHFGDIVVWSLKSKTVAQKLPFWKQKLPYGQICINIFQNDSWWYRSTYCMQISWNLADRKSAKSCVIYRTKKISARSPALASARIAPKICQGQTIYSECPKFYPNPYTSGRVIAGCMNIVETCHKVFPILGKVSSPSNNYWTLWRIWYLFPWHNTVRLLWALMLLQQCLTWNKGHGILSQDRSYVSSNSEVIDWLGFNVPLTALSTLYVISGKGFYRANDITNSVKALKEVVVLRIGFNPTRSTSPSYNPTHACNTLINIIHIQEWI